MTTFTSSDIRDDNKIISHVVLNCLTKEAIQKIKEKREGKTPKEIERLKYKIELKIEGISVPVERFFNALWEQYESQVRTHAMSLVNEKVSSKFSSISDKINEYEEIVRSWAQQINWEIENPFIEK